jgi:hypothetical protein
MLQNPHGAERASPESHMKNLALTHPEPLTADNPFEMRKPVRPFGRPAHFAGRSLSTEEGDLPERPLHGATLNRVKTVMVLCENALGSLP